MYIKSVVLLTDSSTSTTLHLCNILFGDGTVMSIDFHLDGHLPSNHSLVFRPWGLRMAVSGSGSGCAGQDASQTCFNGGRLAAGASQVWWWVDVSVSVSVSVNVDSEVRGGEKRPPSPF